MSALCAPTCHPHTLSSQPSHHALLVAQDSGVLFIIESTSLKESSSKQLLPSHWQPQCVPLAPIPWSENDTCPSLHCWGFVRGGYSGPSRSSH